MAKLTSDKRMSKMRSRLLINSPWFGTLALRLKLIESKEVQTMANNGTVLYYSDSFVQSLSDQQLMAVIAHEVLHCAMGHQFRGGTRDFKKWNEACDIVINKILRESGFDFPDMGFKAEEDYYKGKSSEEVYALRNKEDQKGGKAGANAGSGGAPKPDHHDCDCGLQPAPKGLNQKLPNGQQQQNMSESDWQILAEQAAETAKRAGKLPAGLDFLVKASHQPKVDWRTILRRFITQTIPSDYSWSRPNRRFLANGIYLPGMMKENAPRMGIAVDTSGSIGGKLLEVFAAEITGIVHEVRPEKVDVIYFDAAVQSKESFTPDDAEIILHPKGGGGTNFQPVLDEFAKDPPACMIYLTDGYAPWPKEPDYPVLWAITESSNINEVPWGEFVKISEFD